MGVGGLDKVLFGNGSLNRIKTAGHSRRCGMIRGQDSAFIRSPEPASNNATLAVIGRFEVALSPPPRLRGDSGRFVRENYYPA